MLHPRARLTTSIRRTAGASVLGVVIGAGVFFAPAATAEPEPDPVLPPLPVVISFYDYPSVPGAKTDTAFFMWPYGREGGPLQGRLLTAEGVLRAPVGEVLSYHSDPIDVEALVPGDVAELFDPETGTVLGRAVYDGKPGLDEPICAGSSSATGTQTAGEPLGNIEAITPVPGAQESSMVQINPAVLAEQPADGTTWSATFERPLALGDLVFAFSGVIREGVNVQSFVQRAVADCTPPIAAPIQQPTPAADTTAPAGTSTPMKGAKKLKLEGLTKTGLSFTVTSQENATLRATLKLRTTSGKGKKKKVKQQAVGTTTQPVTAGVPATVKLKPGKKSGSKIKKAAKQPGSKLVTTITLTDAAGNVTTLPASTVSVPKN